MLGWLDELEGATAGPAVATDGPKTYGSSGAKTPINTGIYKKHRKPRQHFAFRHDT